MLEHTLIISIALGSGSFSDGNAKTIEGLATSVRITKPGLPEKNSANVTISNMKLSDMEQLTMLAWEPLKSQNNLIKIQAGDRGSSTAVAFEGEITTAYADFNTAPDVNFCIEAFSGSFPAITPSKQEAIQGEAQAAQLIEKYAGEAGYAFQNESVTASVKNVVLNGSPVDKMRDIANQIGAELIIDDGTVILKWPENTKHGNAVLLSAETGLLGYPTFTNEGIRVKAIYNPDFSLGSLIKVESIVPKATGGWQITKLTHTLEAYKANGGAWFSEIEGIQA